MIAASSEEEWIEIERCADKGARDTVNPKSLCPRIPDLGARSRVMWTEGAREERLTNLQVADVHEPLSSLRRCADMGFESRFGRAAGRSSKRPRMR